MSVTIRFLFVSTPNHAEFKKVFESATLIKSVKDKIFADWPEGVYVYVYVYAYVCEFVHVYVYVSV